MHLLSSVLTMKQKEMLSESLRALRFYTGDVREEDPADPIFSDAKAYVTLNSLLFEGTETEAARSEEGRKLNPAYLRNLKETVRIMENLLNCMKAAEEKMTVYRVERLVDYTCFKKEGMFTSFISCSDAGFLKSYEDKFDLVLMEVHIHKGARCVRVQDALSDYLKSEEKEVLISPYTKIVLKETELKKEYADIRDGRNNPPRVYVQVDVFPAERTDEIPVYPSEDDIEKSVQFYECLNAHEPFSEEDRKAYERVKKYIRVYLNRQS